MQCFCSKNGDGIQTNWWKVSSLSFEEVEYLKALGWVYIPNGSVWGLQEAPYMAYNTEYDCGEDDDDDDDDNDNDDDDDEDDDNEGGIGGVLGASTVGEVLGLASTGDAQAIALLVGTGSLSAAAGLYLLKKISNKKNSN
jgi:LPXTG-motif cell wall-anchored protein